MEIVSYKKRLLNELLELAQRKEAEAEKNSKEAQERANEEEGAMQSRYSTFKEEGQYLAGGLKGLLENFKAATSIIRAIINENIRENYRAESMSIVEIKFEDGTKNKLFIFPVLGGEKIDDLTIINSNAPLARALLLKEAGDNFVLKTGNTIKKGEIISVQ